MLPIVASLLNAGLGILGNAVATKGKDFIQDKLGVNIEDMLGSEEGKIKLQELQYKHEEFLVEQTLRSRELELEATRLEHQNTDSARTMQIAALNQLDIFSKRFVYYLATGWSVFAAIYIGAITFWPIPADNTRFADTILGFLLATVIAVILNYFFGSSNTSKAKDASILEAIKGNNK